MNLLLVDDDKNTLKTLCIELSEMIDKKEIKTIFIAHNKQEVFEKLENNDIDVILLDLLGINGFHILRKLKNDDVYKHIEIIMLSNLDSTDMVDLCINSGAFDYEIKDSSVAGCKKRREAILKAYGKRLRNKKILSQDFRLPGRETNQM